MWILSNYPKPSGSIYYDRYEYFASTGTVVFPGTVEYLLPKDASKERLLICDHCGATYLLNLDTQKPLIRLVCEGCGSSLKFKA